MPRTIRQSATFPATPHQVYEALMDSRQHSAFTGDKAHISREVGGAITAFDGYVSGKNVELIPDQKIVQTWHASDWPAGHESRVTFLVAPVAAGTRLRFTHHNVPDDQYDSIKQGWIDNYWTPLKATFRKAKASD